MTDVTAWGAGLVAIARRWSAPAARGRVMGVLTLSYLFGDSLARLYLGAFVKYGLGWRAVAWVAAGTLAVVFVIGSLLLRPSPTAVGLPEFEPEPPVGRPTLGAILGRLFTRPAFGLVCGMNAGLTTVRETFNSWTPRYLETAVGLPAEDCGLLSSLFPLAGAVAAVCAGFAVDRLRGQFGKLLVGLLTAGVLAMLAVAVLDFRDRPVLALAVTSAVALFIMGPYTFCSGALAQKLGGNDGAGVAANLMDAAGYAVGAVVSGVLAGWLVKQFGFAPLLWVLLGVLTLTLLTAIGFWWDERRGMIQGTKSRGGA
ncbi:MAG: MFS transporter [Gemmataceae bacterium]